MQPKKNIAILENYQTTIDGYYYRLENNPDIQISAVGSFADDFIRETNFNEIDLIIFGVDVHISYENNNPFPISLFIKSVREKNPKLKLIIISYIKNPHTVKFIWQSGVNGYILKEDKQSIQNLNKIVEIIVNGGVYISDEIRSIVYSNDVSTSLTNRQIEVLSLSAAYPDEDTYNLAKRLAISSSSFRNTLSIIYRKLDVRTRAAAISKARYLGIIPTSRLDDSISSKQ